MDKVKPLTGVLSFIILFLCSNYSYAQLTTDGSIFLYKNNTSQTYTIQSGPQIWFGDKSFTIDIPPKETRELRLEGGCDITDPGAVINWDVHNRNEPLKKYDFRLEVKNVRPCLLRKKTLYG
jgi:hypothetical protein